MLLIGRKVEYGFIHHLDKEMQPHVWLIKKETDNTLLLLSLVENVKEIEIHKTQHQWKLIDELQYCSICDEEITNIKNQLEHDKKFYHTRCYDSWNKGKKAIVTFHNGADINETITNIKLVKGVKNVEK